VNPTGSFKDRGMTMAISKALESGVCAVIRAGRVRELPRMVGFQAAGAAPIYETA
jgi:threonine synthase